MKSAALLSVLCLGMLAATAHGASTVKVSLVWVGFDDRVGQWWQTTPNGYRDGHLRLTIDNPGAVLSRLSLNPVIKATGAISTADWWDTSYKSGHWPLGVARGGGALINAGFEPLCDPIGQAPAVYDLYAEDSGVFNADILYRVAAEFADGQKLTAEATVTSASGGPPRAPKPFQFPSVPRPNGSAACVESGKASSTPPPATTSATTTVAKPAAKKPLPLCKKGQKSTARKPCRKR